MTRKNLLRFIGAAVIVLATAQLTFSLMRPELATFELPSTNPALGQRMRGPIDDCLRAEILYLREGGVAAECTENYVHYIPKDLKPAPPRPRGTKTRIGSFNLYHMGDNQAPIKDFAMLAQMADQWDIFGAQELMPLPGPTAENNEMVQQIAFDPRGKLKPGVIADWTIVEPGYLRFLKELRKLDPTWALIMQPEPEGEGNVGEMAGFYYRSGLVKLKDLEYCPKDKVVDLKDRSRRRNLACVVQVRSEQRRLMSRGAFAAFFQIGNFDFVGVTSHVRFREAPLEKDRNDQQKEICAEHATPAKCSISAKFVGRFYEVKAVADQVREMQRWANDEDVLYMGDFNLEPIPQMMLYWSASLKAAADFAVYQNQNTSLSKEKSQLASSYDHFILNAKASQECDTRSAKPYNFTAMAPRDPILKNFATPLAPSYVAAIMNRCEMAATSQVKAAKSRGAMVLRNLNEKELAEALQDCTNALARAAKNRFAAAIELFSDHVPVEITCAINQREND